MSWTNGEQTHIHFATAIGSLDFDVWFDGSFMTPSGRRSVESHNHSIYEVHYIAGGSGSLLVGEREHPLQPNTWHMIGPGVYHAFRSHPRETLARTYLQFSFQTSKRPDDQGGGNESAKIRSVLRELTYVCRDIAPAHRQWIDEIHREIHTRPLGYASRIRCLITLVLLELIREVEPDSRMELAPPRPTKDDLRSALIDQFFDRYDQALTIGELAALLNLSTKQTNRVILEQYQTTFKQKLLDTRIEVAKNMLATTDLTVQEILERVGYSLHRSFGRVFKRKTGFTPVEYRRSKKLDA